MESCAHPAGLKIIGRTRFRCRICGVILDLEGVERWVREAEMARDRAHSASGDGISTREEQEEVYRRRKVLLEMQEVPRALLEARPEMIRVHYEDRGDRYECKVFYKGAGSASSPESFDVGADWERILGLCSRPEPNIRLVADKVREFHGMRLEALRRGEQPPPRRVFYSGEL